MLQLRQYQRQAVDAVFDYWNEEAGNPLVEMATGCHAAGTGILMFDGTVKPVELVAINDNLMGPDSQPRRVLSLARGSEQMYRVTPVKGDPFVVNESHILSLQKTNRYQRGRFPGRKIGGCENVTVRDWLTKPKFWKHIRKLRRVAVDFPANDNSPLPVPAWIVGAMLGDGSMLSSPMITNMDPEILDPICDYAESLGLTCTIRQKPNNQAYSVRFCDKTANSRRPNRLTQKLRQAGVFGLKTGEKKIPQRYKCGSRIERLELLAGLLDTDGHLGGGHHFDYISKSKTLSEDVVFICRSLGLAAYIIETQKQDQNGRSGVYWRVSISGDTSIIPTRVGRKRANARRQIKNPLVTGFSVERVGVGDYYGFALDGDHLYLTADFTVHHNTGKSLSMAELIMRLIGGWSDMRVCVATHVHELIEQNYQELLSVWNFAPAGILSAGVGQYQYSAQILFAGIQTAYNKAGRIGHVDVLLIDECHLVPFDNDTQYRKFITALRAINPDLKIVGLSATPYRLNGGRLDEGDNKLFDRVVYTYGIADGIRDGYLCRLSSFPTVTGYDLKGVGKTAGDYKKDALQKAVDKDAVNKAAVAEVVAKGADRRSWLLFCAGVDHAYHIRDEIRAHGISCETVTGDTPKDERRRIIEDFKAYRLRAVTNNSVLTTGFNHKGVDLIAAMRPTKSASLYVQMMGRGTRPLYAPGMPIETIEQRHAAIAAGPKRNCLVLDFAKLVDEHGPVDMVEPKVPGKGDGEAPIKICPLEEGGCGCKQHASVRECSDCGFVFPVNDKPKIAAAAAEAPILSQAEAEWREVRSRQFDFHDGKGDKPPSVKVSYQVSLGTWIREWLCPQHSGFAKSKADRWWRDHGGERPFPKSVLEWLQRQSELNTTAKISVKPDGKYWTITAHEVGAEKQHPVANDNLRPASNDNNARPTWMDELDDEIPF